MDPFDLAGLPPGETSNKIVAKRIIELVRGEKKPSAGSLRRLWFSRGGPEKGTPEYTSCLRAAAEIPRALVTIGFYTTVSWYEENGSHGVVVRIERPGRPDVVVHGEDEALTICRAGLLSLV